MDEDKFIEKLVERMKDYFPTKREMNTRFDENSDTTEEILASVKVLDKVLEKHPVERIERIEKHLGLPKFAYAEAE